MKLASNNATGT